MNRQNIGQLLSALLLLANGSKANTAAATGSAVDLNDYEGEIAVVQDVAAGGTGSIDGKLQDSADGSTGWADIAGATFTQVTTGASLQKIAVKSDECKRYIRYVGTIVTGPQIVGVHALGVKKYPA